MCKTTNYSVWWGDLNICPSISQMGTACPVPYRHHFFPGAPWNYYNRITWCANIETTVELFLSSNSGKVSFGKHIIQRVMAWQPWWYGNHDDRHQYSTWLFRCLLVIYHKYMLQLSLQNKSVGYSTVTYWTNQFVILGVTSVLLLLFYFCWKILLANNVDLDQTPHDVASDLVCTVCI